MSSPADGVLRAAHAADVTTWQPPEEWQRFISELCDSSQLRAAERLCVLVCGSKNTGKSSLARLLVNALLRKHGIVAYLDTDCGQPELTPPGEQAGFSDHALSMMEPPASHAGASELRSICRSAQPALPDTASARVAKSAPEAAQTRLLHGRCVSAESSHPLLGVCEGSCSAAEG